VNRFSYERRGRRFAAAAAGCADFGVRFAAAVPVVVAGRAAALAMESAAAFADATAFG